MYERVHLKSALSAKLVLEKISAAGGWHDNHGRPCEPQKTDARITRVRVSGNRFTISVRTLPSYTDPLNNPGYRNRSNPVCDGSVMNLPGGGSELRAYYRFPWISRITYAVVTCFFFWIFYMPFGKGMAFSTVRWDSPFEDLFPVLFLTSLLVIFYLSLFWLVRRYFRVEHLQEMMTELVENATGIRTGPVRTPEPDPGLFSRRSATNSVSSK